MKRLDLANMDHLFEMQPTCRTHLATRDELCELLQSGIATINFLKRQIADLQREIEALRGELGYGQTLAMPFVTSSERKAQRRRGGAPVSERTTSPSTRGPVPAKKGKRPPVKKAMSK